MDNSGDNFIHIARIYRETLVKLEDYGRRVREGKDLQGAIEFARYILWSGIPNLCLANECKGEVLRIDGSFLRHLAEELQKDVQARWKSSNTPPSIKLSELEKMNAKLEMIAARISQCGSCRLQPPPAP